MRHDDDPRSPERIRTPAVDDAAAIWRIARDGGLDLNSPYTYLLLCHDFAETCLIAQDEHGDVVGFVAGYRPPARPDVVFVWQVAVAQHVRGRGLGAALLDELLTRTRRLGVRRLEATVTASNDASRRLFASVAQRHDAGLASELRFGADVFPDGGHEDEFLLRIGPFAAPARAPNVAAS